MASYVFLGELAGMFATQSFAVDCQSQQDNFITNFSNHSRCPHGIDISPSNYDQLQRFCHLNETNFTTTVRIAPISLSFRGQVMDKIYWLTIIGFISWLCCSLDIIMWSTSVKRQTSRMNIVLFRSLIQRNL
ncbi:hypothetical protein I4U23_021848 [Adineta vaga]|nr:hypothetical protein I4U23_021848 [Adineta vaga]